MKVFWRMTAAFAAALCLCGVLPTAAAQARIDNSDLIPKIVPDAQVALKDGTPDWADDLILAQFRLETATPEGTLEAAVRVLDHYAEMGVNGLLILPVADRPDDPAVNGYGNCGPDTIFTRITGTTDYAAGWAKFKTFVDEAHRHNLRVIVDITTWGILQIAPVYRAHPEWFVPVSHTAGSYLQANCNWTKQGLIDHWADALVRVARDTGLDGYRCDCEPSMSGYSLYGVVRERLAAMGRKILVISEGVSHRTGVAGEPVYDFEQWGGVTYHDRSKQGWGERLMATPNDTFLHHVNIVDAVKTRGDATIYADGRHRLYVNMLSCHDYTQTVALGDRVYMGYQAVFAPFIPMWFIGEEWNNPDKCTGAGVLYYNQINWTAKDKPENTAFFEDVKRMIRVRRQYPEVFTYFPDSVRDANICKVATSRNGLQAYARWQGDTAVLVVPNADDVLDKRKYTVTVPWESMGLTGERYVITDAYTGKVLVQGKPDTFSVSIAARHVGAFVIRPATPSVTTTAVTTVTAAATLPTTPPTAPAAQPTASTAVSSADTTVTAPAPTVPSTATPSTHAPTTGMPADTAADSAPPVWLWGVAAGGAALLAAAAWAVVRKVKP